MLLVFSVLLEWLFEHSQVHVATLPMAPPAGACVWCPVRGMLLLCNGCY
jgi:hypothetical protein